MRRWQRDPWRDGFIVAAGIWCGLLFLGVVDGATDARGWWASPWPDPYVNRDYSTGYGLYFSPSFALGFFPLTLLSWPAFAAVWTGVMFAALAALAGRWAALTLLIPVVWWEINAANIALLLGLAVVVGFRWPAAWAFIILTKVTPGIALVWFAVRREWRELAIVAGATALVVLPAAVLVPDLWFDWIDLLESNAGQDGPDYFTVPVPLPVRLVAAVLLVAWGARADRKWTVVVAVTVSVPVLWYNALATLIAIIPVVSIANSHRLGPAFDAVVSRGPRKNPDD